MSPAPQVVVAEASPTYQGQQMATELGALGIHATLVADSAIFAMMARVNKVGLRDGDMLLRCLLPAIGWQAAEPANWWLSPRCLKHRPLHLLPARLGVQVVATAQALLLALASGFGYAVYTVAAKRLMTDGPRSDEVMAGAFSLGGLLLVPPQYHGRHDAP